MTMESSMMKHHQWGVWHGVGAFFLWFIIIAIVFWLIYFSIKPSWALRPNTGEIDTGKILLAAIITSLVIVVIVWLIKCSFMSCYKY